MNNTVKLSKRLEKVSTFITAGAVFADIGSDHAYLPCHVCLRDDKARAIAGEVNQGPFNSAIEAVTKNNLSDRIDVRLGDGLSVLQDDEVNLVVVAGMGGSLIKTILEEGKDRLRSVKRIVTQPNVDERNLRKWFNENDYIITNEVIIEENGHIYEIIVADRGADENPYTDEFKEKQLLFGPLLLKNKSNIFYQKWSRESAKRVNVITEMKKANEQNQEKIEVFKTELSWIQEVLQNDSDNS